MKHNELLEKIIYHIVTNQLYTKNTIQFTGCSDEFMDEARELVMYLMKFFDHEYDRQTHSFHSVMSILMDYSCLQIIVEKEFVDFINASFQLVLPDLFHSVINSFEFMKHENTSLNFMTKQILIRSVVN